MNIEQENQSAREGQVFIDSGDHRVATFLELTEGVVKDILTNSAVHHRGIKVRLEGGIVGRVQEILG